MVTFGVFFSFDFEGVFSQIPVASELIMKPLWFPCSELRDLLGVGLISRLRAANFGRDRFIPIMLMIGSTCM